MVLSCIILCIAFALGHVLPLTAGCGQQHFHKGRRIAEVSGGSRPAFGVARCLESTPCHTLFI